MTRTVAQLWGYVANHPLETIVAVVINSAAFRRGSDQPFGSTR